LILAVVLTETGARKWGKKKKLERKSEEKVDIAAVVLTDTGARKEEIGGRRKI
jgi:hypothetical protein